MPILAIDTASRWTAIALLDEQKDKIIAEKGWVATLRQTVELAPSIDEMLQNAALRPADLSGISVAIGPGSYTGLRIGMGLARGLALVHKLPIAAIRTHDIVAQNVPQSPQKLLVGVEAGRKRVLIAPYVWSQEKKQGWDRAGEIDNPTWPELFESIQEPVLLAGEVPSEIAEQIQSNADLSKMIELAAAEYSVRSAAILARLGHQQISSGSLPDQDLLVPQYLRHP